MQNRLFKKGLVAGIIVLFISIGIQPTLCKEVSIPIVSDNKKDFIEITDKNNDKEDFGIGFILCTVSATDWAERKHYPLARNVMFELTDYDTGEVIQEKFHTFGIHFFTFLPRGHSYVIKVSISQGWETEVIQDLNFFYWVDICIIYY